MRFDSRSPVRLNVSDLAISNNGHRSTRHTGLGECLVGELIDLLSQLG